MLKEIIQNLNQQLSYQPKIENGQNLQRKKKFVVCGMGGSNLAGGIVESWQPNLDVVLHRDYGLPNIDESDLKNYLIILSSYSGNTEETVSAFEEAQSRGLPSVVIATGGKLLELAEKNQTSYIQTPHIGNHPRFAIGYNIMAMLVAMGEDLILKDIQNWAASFDSGKYESVGKELAGKLQNKIPIIYSSGDNAGLARYWKISFNETAKIPAFYNFWPELNHNEMVGFSKPQKGVEFAFVFLNDPSDPPQIQKRAAATQKLFKEWGCSVSGVVLDGSTHYQKSFSSIATAMWTSYHFAESSGVNPEDISVIENFKASVK